jgi:hypothetical protein
VTVLWLGTLGFDLNTVHIRYDSNRAKRVFALDSKPQLLSSSVLHEIRIVY